MPTDPGTRQDLLEVLKMVRQGLIRPVIHAEMPLSAAAEAHQMMEDRRIFGKVLLVPSVPSG